MRIDFVADGRQARAQLQNLKRLTRVDFLHARVPADAAQPLQVHVKVNDRPLGKFVFLPGREMAFGLRQTELAAGAPAHAPAVNDRDDLVVVLDAGELTGVEIWAD